LNQAWSRARATTLTRLADDGGRADLLDSVHFARERVDHPDSLVLVGWSMGGLAAAGLTVDGTFPAE